MFRRMPLKPMPTITDLALVLYVVAVLLLALLVVLYPAAID